MNIPTQNPSVDLVTLSNGIPKTTSLIVAEKFGKRHRDVLRCIESLECSQVFRERNFALTSHHIPMPNGGARKEPAYDITRDGFTFLAMGFTGKEAAKWKEAYIDAFNRMETALMRPSPHVAGDPDLVFLRDFLATRATASMTELVSALYPHQPESRTRAAAIRLGRLIHLHFPEWRRYRPGSGRHREWRYRRESAVSLPSAGHGPAIAKESSAIAPGALPLNTRLLLTLENGVVAAAEVVDPEQWVLYQTIQRNAAKMVDPSSKESVVKFLRECVPYALLPAIAMDCVARLGYVALPALKAGDQR